MFTALAKVINSVLDELPNGDNDAMFTARMSRIEDDFVGTYKLGDPVSVTFRSDPDLYLSIAYVDAQGILLLMQLEMGYGLGLLKGGVVQEYPIPKTFFMETQPPLGLERAYYVATRNHVDQNIFYSALNTGGDPSKKFQQEDSIKLAKKYVASILKSNSPSEVSTVVLDSLIVEREEGPRYTIGEIVGYYSARGTRMITSSVLESRIRFDSNSAVLSEEAKRNLYVWGEAFLNPKISDYKFQIGGYTDDIESNHRLSEKRAESVLNYLTSTFDIDEERFTVVGHGETNPIAKNVDSESRAINRRVEFQLLID